MTTDASTEATATAEKPEKKEIDLSGFSTAVQAAVANRDTSTGELAVAVIEPVVAAYRALDGIAAKNASKKYLQNQMRDAMNSMDISLARSYMVLQDNLSAGTPVPKVRAEKAPADPTEAAVQRLVTIELARQLVVLPEGVADDVTEQADKLYGEVFEIAKSYLDWSQDESESRGDEPDAPLFVKNGVKLALGKPARAGGAARGTGAGGERHDIGEHIRQAFEDEPAGTFLTIAQIRSKRSTEYGDNPPSAGAVSARLFPKSGKCSLDFVTPGTNSAGNKGATKR